MRDIENDKAKLERYWEMDYLEDGDDIKEILNISDYWIDQYEQAHLRIGENVKTIIQLHKEVEMLESNNAALMECVKFHAWIGSSNARECLEKIGKLN